MKSQESRLCTCASAAASPTCLLLPASPDVEAHACSRLPLQTSSKRRRSRERLSRKAAEQESRSSCRQNPGFKKKERREEERERRSTGRRQDARDADKKLQLLHHRKREGARDAKRSKVCRRRKRNYERESRMRDKSKGRPGFQKQLVKGHSTAAPSERHVQRLSPSADH